VQLWRIEIEGFKVFKEKTVLGPFRQLSCVIGPNGGGKSCLVVRSSLILITQCCVQFEAVAFALGGNLRLILGKNVDSLINEQKNRL